tara:strand:- start:393 stop:632 length:240 start_codon:yes stop_codon:yes gene_type:complete
MASKFRGHFYIYTKLIMKSLKKIRDILSVVWGISIVARIVSKTTNLFEIPKWSGVAILINIFLVILLSVFIYFKKKIKK